MRTETEVLSPTAPEPGQRGAMAGPQPLALLLTLLTLCLTAGTPEVWVQIQMESTKVPSFTVRCGFLGSGSISLVTVSWGGPDVAGGTRLAVLHPDLGTQQWAPAHQAHWEARTNISLTLGGSEGKSPSPNSTFCCKFVSFPEGSQEACGNLLLSTDQGQSLGFRRPTPAPGHKCELRVPRWQNYVMERACTLSHCLEESHPGTLRIHTGMIGEDPEDPEESETARWKEPGSLNPQLEERHPREPLIRNIYTGKYMNED